MSTWGILQFPGSNSDWDAYRVFEQLEGVSPEMHWHEDKISAGKYQVMIIPGGFSFGDYLRAGAIAKLSHAMSSLPEAIEKGCHVMGICNGFQILLESRLLPGVLQVNQNLKFISKRVECEISEKAFPWFQKKDIHQKLELPIAHGFGNYQLSPVDRSEIQAVIKYVENPNGSKENIAGIYRKMGEGSVMGLMPHPERASLADLKHCDGSLFWQNALEVLKA